MILISVMGTVQVKKKTLAPRFFSFFSPVVIDTLDLMTTHLLLVYYSFITRLLLVITRLLLISFKGTSTTPVTEYVSEMSNH